MADDDLFATHRAEVKRASAPLPARMRPRTLDEVVGQRHLLAPGAAFRSMVEAGRISSMILWGPPGTGKTTLANLVAKEVHGTLERLSATSAGVKDVREVLARAEQRLGEDRGRTILFLDEIHRFNKAQQDALLPGVEDGTVTLVGATTENPFFEVNSPLISRATVFRTEALSSEEVEELIRRATADPMRGLTGVSVTDEAIAAIAMGGGASTVDVASVEEALQRRIIRYDRAGDRHYDVISAFIKSLRGSDPDAALYWLQTMVHAGEDPKFIARRMVVFASEDVGLADNTMLHVALGAFRAVEVVGLPEANYALAHAAIALALAPKSNSVTRAMHLASGAVEEGPHGEVPPHLRSGTTEGDRNQGFGVGYQYPHDDARGVVRQQYLPDGSTTAQFFAPRNSGDERDLAERLARIDRILGKRPRS